MAEVRYEQATRVYPGTDVPAVRATSATLPPRATQRLATARPIPLDAPVTSAIAMSVI